MCIKYMHMHKKKFAVWKVRIDGAKQGIGYSYTGAENVSLARKVKSGRHDEQRVASLVHPIAAEALVFDGIIALVFYHR